MRKSVIVVIIIAIALILFGSYAAYYVHAVKSVKVTDVNINSLGNFTLAGFIIKGDVEAYNPSLISIEIRKTDLEFSLKETGQILSTGVLEGTVLKPKSTQKIPFEQEIVWGGILSTALDIINTNETIIVIDGKMEISKYVDVSIPFSKEYDINRQVKEYTSNMLNEKLKEKAGGFLEKIFGQNPIEP